MLDVVRHIRYIKDLVGIDYVGLGSDFDGLYDEDMMQDIRGVKDISYLQQILQKEGFTRQEINKVMGENWLRVLKENM